MKISPDYSILSRATSYYESLGYQLIEVPWVVDQEFINVTAPIGKYSNAKSMVSSGEQSFLQMIMTGVLKTGKYCCITPCYRPYDVVDETHSTQFVKLELIDHLNISYNYHYKSDTWDARLKSESLEIANFASAFMSNERKKAGLGSDLEIRETTDEPRSCRTIFNADIMCGDVELGSYGARMSKSGHSWIYGTGVALPRIQYERT